MSTPNSDVIGQNVPQFAASIAGRYEPAHHHLLFRPRMVMSWIFSIYSGLVPGTPPAMSHAAANSAGKNQCCADLVGYGSVHAPSRARRNRDLHQRCIGATTPFTNNIDSPAKFYRLIPSP